MKKLIAVFVCLLVSASVILANVIPVNADEEITVSVGNLFIKGEGITKGDDYDYDESTGLLTILSDKTMTISGESNSAKTVVNRIVVNSQSGANLILSDLTIDSSTIKVAALEIDAGITNEEAIINITLEGDNKLISAPDHAGLQKSSETCKLVISEIKDGVGSLTATGGKESAGIGGGPNSNGSNIIINSGTIKAYGDDCGAGIGGGNGGNGSNIQIYGGTIIAEGGSGGGAGIGGGNGGRGEKIYIFDCRGITANGTGGGAGIGGGKDGNGNDIQIQGGTDIEATGSSSAAGIGGGGNGSGTKITISGGENIIANGGNSGAGIGGGENGSGSDITISGGSVTANGNFGSAGIGGGAYSSGSGITISGGTVTANGGIAGAGIGGGGSGAGTNITISGSADVTAKGYNGGAGIGGGMGGEGSGITISGGTVKASCETASGAKYGAGIGGGTNGSGSNIEISGSADVKAFGCPYDIDGGTGTGGGEGGGAGIGGGAGGSGSDIRIKGCKEVTATGGGNGAGIGGGEGGSGSNIKISGGTQITAIGYVGGAGIGGGSEGEGSDIKIWGSADVTATGGYRGAGIGGGFKKQGYDITIGDENETDITKLLVTAISNGDVSGGRGNGAGIGGGGDGNGEKITINNGTVIAESDLGAGIGGGYVTNPYSGKIGSDGINITINGGNIKATSNEGGAGIGGGQQGGCGNGIFINGGTVTAINKSTNDAGGAGIGGGSSFNTTIKGNGDNIVIKGGIIKATGTGGGTGIGGGNGGDGTGIEISGNADVTAIGAIQMVHDSNGDYEGLYGGAGIGGGGAGGAGIGITISDNAKVTATSLKDGADIGSGSSGGATNITISGNADVTVDNRGCFVCIGGCKYSNEECLIEITGGTVRTTTENTPGNTDVSADIGIGSPVRADITISGNAKVEAASSQIGIGTIIGLGSVKIDGAKEVTAAGSDAGINCNNITINGNNDTKVTAICNNADSGVGIGSALDSKNCTVTITGGKVKATNTAGGTGIGDDGSTVDIKGTSSTSYPWVFTNKITRANSDNDYLGIVFEGDGTDGTVYGGEIILTEDYTFETGGKLTVVGTAKFHTDNKLTLDNDSILYLKAGATLDKYNKMNIISGEIQHEGASVYVKDDSGKTVCDICGKDQKHNWGSDWSKNSSHHWHECTGGQDCSVYHYDIPASECSITEDSKKDGYEAHIYDFDNPTDKGDGRLYYRCIVCDYEYSVEIPVIHLIKVDGTTGDPLEGARFGIYSNEQCTDLVTTRTTALDADNNAAISFAALPDKTYYIKETDAPDGYRISDKVFRAAVGADGKITYSVAGSADTSEEIPVCKNYDVSVIIPDPAKIIKVDGETGEPLAGARFGIYSDAECTSLVTTGTTVMGEDNKAAVSFDTELNKTYYIKETAAPDGYKVSEEVYKAVVDADGKVTYSIVGSAGTSEEIPVCKNYVVKVIIPDPAKVIKVDGETGEPLAGAQFSIYSDEECTSLITTGTTATGADNKAVVSFNTELNKTYYIRETKAPDGYKVSEEVYKAVVGADGKVTYSVVGSAGTSEEIPVCRNYAVKVTISDPVKIIKVDGETGAPLAGARFGLYSDVECTVLITTGNTVIGADNKAVVTFATEPNRTYYIRENAAPDGYKVSDVVFKAVVDANGKVTYGVAGSQTTSEDIPVCKNEKTADDDTSVPEDTPSDEAHNPETGDTGGFTTAGIAILSGITCAASLMEGAWRRKRKNSDDDETDFESEQ